MGENICDSIFREPHVTVAPKGTFLAYSNCTSVTLIYMEPSIVWIWLRNFGLLKMSMVNWLLSKVHVSSYRSDFN